MKEEYLSMETVEKLAKYEELQRRINAANIKLEILQKDLMKLLKTGIPIKDITDIQDVLSGEDIRRAVKELEETKDKSYDGYFTNYNIGGENDE